MTHIAVTTSENQLVTIDMPESETKRITVRESSLVVEDKDFQSGVAGADAGAPSPSVQEKKPVIVPTGSMKKPTTFATGSIQHSGSKL